MSHSHSSPLEVTQALLNCARAAGFRFRDDTALVAVQHMLKQTVDLFQTVVAMGLSLKNIFALGKVYSNSAKVIETLRAMGITVVESVMPPPGEFHHYFEEDTKKLWQIAAEHLARRGIKRVLVLDDGGVCITSVTPEILERYSLCGIEQTSLGMFLFEEKPPPFAVMSWARAAVKLEIGGPLFSQCFIEKFNTEFLRHRPLTRKQLGVIGMGSIGRSLANLALREGNEVLYYDPNTAIRSHSTDKVTRLDSLEELMIRCDYVVGCSGRNPFNNKWPLKYKPGIKLLSASGGDQEFGPIINDLKQRSSLNIDSETWDLSFADGQIQIAYMGYPYNFVSRAIEAVPTRIVQLETGGLLAALVQANVYLDLCEAGEASNRGIHRISTGAQRFILERWLQAMGDHKINIVDLYGYHSAVFNAAKHDEWFAEKSDPHIAHPTLEERMSRFLYEEGTNKRWTIAAR
jgi:hypothetical protein